jgi:WXG100 family type VII secretion target
MADKIEVNYGDLQRLAGGFNNGADSVEAMINKIKAQVENLRSTWEGRGADAFFKEMDELVFPGLNKLKAALGQASQTTNQLATVFQQAESEASGLFNQD